MEFKANFNCVECKRKKIKCDRKQPCSCCTKSSIYCFYISKKRNLSHIQNESSENQMSRYHIKASAKFEKKWSRIANTFEKIVDWCQNEPELDFILPALDSEIYEDLFGNKINKKLIKPRRKVYLYNSGINPSITKFIEGLVSMSFQFCTFSPCTVETIQEAYYNYGLNSYLINSIAACALPVYAMKRGEEDISPKDNIFYLRTLYLLHNQKTSMKELILGTVYLLQAESSYDNMWAFYIHFKKLSSLLYQANIDKIDANHSFSRNESFDLFTCEMRNAWWVYTSYDAMYSVFTLNRPTANNDPKNLYLPHPDLDFNPGPFDPVEELGHSVPKPSIPTPYQTIGNFNSLSQFTWLSQRVSSMVHIYLNIRKISYSKRQLSNILKDFQYSVNNAAIKYLHKFDFELYEKNIISNPDFYATTGHLTSIIGVNHIYNAYLMIEAKFYSQLKKREKAQESRNKAKIAGKRMVEFIKKTFKLPGYSPPVLDLTEHYITSLSLMRTIIYLAKIFSPAESDEDLEIQQYLIEFAKQHASFRPSVKYYVKWCESHLTTNGDLKINQKSEFMPILLKVFHENF